MKFILFDAQDISKTVLNKIQLEDNDYVNEIIISKNILDRMNIQPKSIIEKLKYKINDRRIEKTILHSLENHDKKWNYILSKNINKKNMYLESKIQQLLGYKISNISEMETNIFKYIDEYVNENKLKKHEIKMLLVIANCKNLNITLLSKLIGEYKAVNIYLSDKPSEYILKRIGQINKTEGTTIEILNKERKSFTEYNVIYFIDDFRQNYPRFRLNKNAKVLDLEEAKKDKYNSNIVYLNTYINKQYVNVKNIQELKEKYNFIELAVAINKITNVLDKS